jgi:outer membrane protein OmpA-like peptidoglycan-associated protein
MAMSPIRFAPLAIALLPVSAGIAQIRADPSPPVLAPPPIVTAPPRAPRIRDYPQFHDGLIRIYFDYGSASLSPTAARIVDLAARQARRCHYLGIAIAGHVDSATRRSRALILSRRMAETVRRALIARGLDPARIEADGFGASRPAVATAPGVREPYNRRTEMDIRCPGDPPGPVPDQVKLPAPLRPISDIRAGPASRRR